MATIELSVTDLTAERDDPGVSRIRANGRELLLWRWESESGEVTRHYVDSDTVRAKRDNYGLRLLLDRYVRRYGDIDAEEATE